MSNLLLISSSRVHGSGFLDHCREAIREHLAPASRLLFVPYALADHDTYFKIVADALSDIDVVVDSIHRASDPQIEVGKADAIFVGGGNTFRLLDRLYRLDLLKTIRSAVQQGMPYMGSSAGTNMACPTIKTTNDMPIVEPPSFAALSLIPFQINPHFVDADPNSTHKGETREQRLTEYLEDNDIPVIGIREGSWLRVEQQSYLLKGDRRATWFAKGQPPRELLPDTEIAQLL
jgi:dipeptidase E